MAMDFLGKSSMEHNGYSADASLLQKDDNERSLKRASNPLYQKFLIIIATVLFGGLVASVFWAIFLPMRSCPATHPEPEPEHPITEVLHCGNNPAEARSLGCKLQTWSYGWVPEPCFDPELNQEFIEIHKRDNLPYYADSNGTQIVDFNTVYEGNLEVLYTVWGSHFWHCAFMMRKFFRRQAATTVAGWEYEHITHCQNWVADPFRYNFLRVNIKAPLFYAKCDPHGLIEFAPGKFEVVE